LVIGISDYSGTSSDLQYCDDDANDWKTRLQAEGYSVTIILDRNATKSAIESAVNTLASRSVAGNTIAFCYSGHGSSGNIVTTDLYYISSSWFKTKFTNSTSTKMMFCFDACQIGAMKTSLSKTGRVIAVASNTTVYSYDGDATMKNGVFTYYQMRGFDYMGYVYLESDCSYACTQMKSWASARGLTVAPSYGDYYSGSFDL
ncbi:MAG: caspase family protein, partial [Bacteroidales bacterium]